MTRTPCYDLTTNTHCRYWIIETINPDVRSRGKVPPQKVFRCRNPYYMKILGEFWQGSMTREDAVKQGLSNGCAKYRYDWKNDVIIDESNKMAKRLHKIKQTFRDQTPEEHTSLLESYEQKGEELKNDTENETMTVLIAETVENWQKENIPKLVGITYIDPPTTVTYDKIDNFWKIRYRLISKLLREKGRSVNVWKTTGHVRKIRTELTITLTHWKSENPISTTQGEKIMAEQNDENYKRGNKYQVIFYLSEDEYKRLKKMRKKLDPFKTGSFNQFVKELIIRWGKAW